MIFRDNVFIEREYITLELDITIRKKADKAKRNKVGKETKSENLIKKVGK